MAIIQPQPGLSTTNRYYKAYPGIEYNVKVGVLGGTFPFVYSLTTYPSGMTINADTGVITWPNPTTSGSPHSVTVRVEDDENTVVTRSWTITVTTSGFYFLDAVNGSDGNAGTLASPWKTMGAFYQNEKDLTTYSTAFLYFKNGTYYTTTANIEYETARVNMGNKPKVWLAYPGHSPAINATSHYLLFNSAQYLDGFDIYHPTLYGLMIGSSGTGSVIRRNAFHGIHADGSSNNQSAIMISNSGTVGANKLYSENTCNDMVNAYFIIGYSTSKAVVEYNTMSNFSESGANSHGIGPKSTNHDWSIRKNTAVTNMTTRGSIHINTYVPAACYNFDISFNNIKDAGYALATGLELSGYGPVWSYRNTYQGSVQILRYTGASVMSFYRDIHIGSYSYSGGGTPTRTEVLTTAGAVTSLGLLQGTYRDTYLGIKGWEIAVEADPGPPPVPSIMPPGKLRVAAGSKGRRRTLH
jgi:hypothetical protein